MHQISIKTAGMGRVNKTIVAHGFRVDHYLRVTKSKDRVKARNAMAEMWAKQREASNAKR